MRLSEFHKKYILDAAHKCFGNKAKIWLFGSRVDDTKKGGDIDLYIETDMQSGTVSAKLDFLGMLRDVFGDQKIDILVRSRSKEMTPIQVIAKNSGMELV